MRWNKLIRAPKIDKSGFTLIEAMVFAGILAVLISTFASYQFQRARLTKATESRQEYGQLARDFHSSINQPETLIRSEAATSGSSSLAVDDTGPVAPPMPQPASSPSLCPTACVYNETTGQCIANQSGCNTTTPNNCGTNTQGCTIPPPAS